MSKMPVFNRPFESNSSSEPAPAKPSKNPKSSKTIRLNIDLNQMNRDGSVVFNYVQLVNEEKARRARGDHSGGKSESKSDLKRLKMTDTKYQSYAELGAGYDDDDSFIDNTDAYEECLPENMDTKYGGYYINTGELELKKTFSRPLDVSSSPDSPSESSDSSESSSEGEEAPPPPPVAAPAKPPPPQPHHPPPTAPPLHIKREHDSADSRKPHSDGEKRKKAKIIHVPTKESTRDGPIYMHHPLPERPWQGQPQEILREIHSLEETLEECTSKDFHE